jgi:hypothetical protein
MVEKPSANRAGQFHRQPGNYKTFTPALSSPETTKRPWHRLHFSTWLLILACLALLIVIVAPGEFCGGTVGSIVKLKHGWPWTFVSRQDFYYPPYDPEVWPGWTMSWTWPFEGEILVFDRLNLALDILVALGIIGAIGIALEMRRRRRKLYQWTLREMLCFVLLTACFFSWFAVHEKYGYDEAKLVQKMISDLSNTRTVIRVEKDNICPSFLRRFLGYRLTCYFDAVSTISISKKGTPIVKEDLIVLHPYIDKLKYFNFLAIHTDSDMDESVFQAISTIPNLKTLYLYSDPKVMTLAKDKIRHLARLTDLQNLDLNGFSEIRDSRELGALPKLEKFSLVRVDAIDDPRLDLLSTMPHLKALMFLVIPLDDTVVDNIISLKSLNTLYISNTNISQQGIDKIKTSLPNCYMNCWAKRPISNTSPIIPSNTPSDSPR